MSGSRSTGTLMAAQAFVGLVIAALALPTIAGSVQIRMRRHLDEVAALSHASIAVLAFPSIAAGLEVCVRRQLDRNAAFRGRSIAPHHSPNLARKSLSSDSRWPVARWPVQASADSLIARLARPSLSHSSWLSRAPVFRTDTALRTQQARGLKAKFASSTQGVQGDSTSSHVAHVQLLCANEIVTSQRKSRRGNRIGHRPG